MSHLLVISVGPVQEFIAAARRTRDLWFGSYLLSEISKTVAMSVKNQGGNLIFPNPATDLTPGKEEVNIANVILAELPAKIQPKTVAEESTKRAEARWLEFANSALQETRVANGMQSRVVREDVWDGQVNDVIECYAAWVEWSGKYKIDRSSGMRLLSGRKNCRDFGPGNGHAGLAKSSLDGQRETVLHPPSEWQRRFRAKLRIRKGEQLDVVGLVKRLAEGNRPYPSVSRIAADPWVRGNLRELDEVVKACKDLERQEILRPLNTNAYPKYSNFPYEGSAVYPSRHHELLEETCDEEDRSLEKLKALRDALAKLPEPNPYFAVLVADGDKMGAAISALDSADTNRDFSKILGDFATAAQTIVTDHHGVLVYAGGDDVLAFLPVDKCLECARKLHDEFGALLTSYKADGKSPTLSVGIAIGHFMENLEDLLDFGRKAEKAAKAVEGKNALAVHLHKRGGVPVRVASSWTDDPDHRLNKYARLINQEAIPGKLPYDLRTLAEVYQQWPQDSLIAALRKDVLRVIRDKQPKAGRAYMQEIEQLVASRLNDAASLHRFADELLVARQIAVAMQQAGAIYAQNQGARP